MSTSQNFKNPSVCIEARVSPPKRISKTLEPLCTLTHNILCSLGRPNRRLKVQLLQSISPNINPALKNISARHFIPEDKFLEGMILALNVNVK